MIANHKFGECLPTFGNFADRYCLSGHGGRHRGDSRCRRLQIVGTCPESIESMKKGMP